MRGKVYDVPAAFAANTHMTFARYQEMYAQSIQQPEDFWAQQALRYITWFVEPEKTLVGNFADLNVHWFPGGKLNVTYNCLDRHLPKRAQQAALIWEADDPQHTLTLTYQELFEQVCSFANVLKEYGVKKGDRVCIYLPMVPEAVVAMLACARLGAIHSVVFGGFSAEALQTRILDADCSVVITANEGIRGNKTIPLKKNVDTALIDCPHVRTVFVVKRTETLPDWYPERDVWYHDVIRRASKVCEAEIMDAEDPLFILYTSGSTGKPKGILHGSGGYSVYAAMTHALIFDYHDQEIYWCTADIGWITGHTYGVYGPLLNGAMTVLFEGVPNYPTPARCWEIIDKHQVNIFYTAPTAIRALRSEGDAWVQQTKRSSLRLLGSVGEPINPEAWEWYYAVVGDSRCPIVDTWWQTETGGIMISAFPGATPLKPGAAAWPFFGVVPEIVDDEWQAVPPHHMGKLVIKQPWPGMLQTIYHNPDRFVNAYFKDIPNCYSTGDQAYQDEDGYYFISGRSDDVLKISGHRIGTQEVESAIIRHHAVAEAAVVGVPHPIKGQSIYAYVTLKLDFQGTAEFEREIIQIVRTAIGALATPEHIQWTVALPKTRSGKIMRRLLRNIANNEVDDLGDLSTLADPSVVQELVRLRRQK